MATATDRAPTGLLADPEWRVERGQIAYPQALEQMEARNQAIEQGSARELLWLIEHPPLYTAGTSADPAELLSQQFPVYDSGRGGRYTYHGPGQRVGYVLLDLRQRACVPTGISRQENTSAHENSFTRQSLGKIVPNFASHRINGMMQIATVEIIDPSYNPLLSSISSRITP